MSTKLKKKNGRLERQKCHTIKSRRGPSCVFPFQFGDKKYYGCLEDRTVNTNYGRDWYWAWCATEVDEDGIFQGSRDNSDDPWVYCDTDCQSHEEALTWLPDETVKVTLQYHNKALWAGLELYGNLLTGFFLYSLILTVLISAIGNI